jgi:integrase
VQAPTRWSPGLREHVRRWAEPGSHGRVFVGAEGGDGRANLNRLWQWAAGKAGIDPAVGLHFHDLRHTGNHLTDGPASRTWCDASATPAPGQR